MEAFAFGPGRIGRPRGANALSAGNPWNGVLMEIRTIRLEYIDEEDWHAVISVGEDNYILRVGEWLMFGGYELVVFKPECAKGGDLLTNAI